MTIFFTVVVTVLFGPLFSSAQQDSLSRRHTQCVLEKYYSLNPRVKNCEFFGNMYVAGLKTVFLECNTTVLTTASRDELRNYSEQSPLFKEMSRNALNADLLQIPFCTNAVGYYDSNLEYRLPDDSAARGFTNAIKNSFISN